MGRAVQRGSQEVTFSWRAVLPPEKMQIVGTGDCETGERVLLLMLFYPFSPSDTFVLET